MARQSVEARNIASLAERRGIGQVERPAPPQELTREEAVVWTMVTCRMAPDHFPEETHPLLVQFARCVLTLRKLAEARGKIEVAKSQGRS